MATDGFTDQVGGEKGLPFGKKRLKSVLAAHQGRRLDQQGDELKRVWRQYRSDAEQRDDVTFIGFSVPPAQGVAHDH